MDFYGILLGGMLDIMFLLWPLFALAGAMLIVKTAFIIWESSRLAKSGISEIDNMDGRTFEKYLEVLFAKLGHDVKLTKYIGDYGADLVTVKNGVKTAIQAKRYKNRVGVKAIQEAVASKGYYSCDKAMVVTNSFFTKQAIELARSNEVELWDRNRLVKELLTIKGEGSSPITSQVVTSNNLREETPIEPSSDTCAKCGKKVSEKVEKYCLSNPQRFRGKVYCYDDQKGF